MPIKLSCLAALAFVVALIGTPNSNSRGQTKRKAAASVGAQTVVFVVEKWEGGEAQIDPVVVVRDGRLTPPPEGLDGDEKTTSSPSSKFIAEFYRPGRQYRLLFGGAEVGAVEVVREIEPACVTITASVSVQGPVKLGGEVRALATDSQTLGKLAHDRRAPTEAERVAALALARTAYGQKRVPGTLVQKLKTINLTAIDLDRDGKTELIGSFEIEGRDFAHHALLMIAELKGDSYQSAMTWYHLGVESSAQSRRLIDVLDLNNDGTAEVIAMGGYYESHDYLIYQKLRGKWQSVYQGGGGGC